MSGCWLIGGWPERAEAKATRIERLSQLLDGAANLLNLPLTGYASTLWDNFGPGEHGPQSRQQMRLEICTGRVIWCA